MGEYIWGKEIDSEIEGKYSVMECPPVEKNALFEEYIAMHSEGDVVKGYVINTDERNGAFINIYPGIIALFHKSEYTAQFDADIIQSKKLVAVQIGKIDMIKKRISLIPAYKKNVNVAVEIKGIDKEKFLDSVEINGKVCDSYRECTDNYAISDVEIRKIIAESYEKAVDEDTILMYNESFTFQINGIK